MSVHNARPSPLAPAGRGARLRVDTVHALCHTEAMTNTYAEGDRVYWSTRETTARVVRVNGQELTIMVPGDRLPVTTRACFVRPLGVTA